MLTEMSSGVRCCWEAAYGVVDDDAKEDGEEATLPACIRDPALEFLEGKDLDVRKLF